MTTEPAAPTEFAPHPIRALALIAELLGHTFGETCGYPVSHETNTDGCQRPADLGWTVDRGWLRVARTCSAGHESAWRDIYPLPIEAFESEQLDAIPDPAPSAAGDPYVVQWDGTALGGTVIAGHVDRLGGVAVARTDETGTGGDDMLIHPPGDRPMIALRKGGWLAVTEGRWGAGPTMSDAVHATLDVEPRGIGFPPSRAQVVNERPIGAPGGYMEGPGDILEQVKFLELPTLRWTTHETLLESNGVVTSPMPDGFEPFAVTVVDGVQHIWSKSARRT